MSTIGNTNVTPKPFALAPGLLGTDTIDYSTTMGHKMFYAATAELKNEKFDLTPEGLTSFLTKLEEKAIAHGWSDILLIPENALVDPNANLTNLLEHYGEVTLSQIIEHANTYCNVACRSAQDSYQL